MGQLLKSVLGIAAVSALTLGVTGLAEAGACKGRQCKYEREGREAGVYRYITAEATFGVSKVSAPVRHGRWGDEVRVGNNWIDCEITCEYTLRRLTVDFWDGVGQGRTVTPGYFRFDLDLDDGRIYRRRYN